MILLCLQKMNSGSGSDKGERGNGEDWRLPHKRKKKKRQRDRESDDEKGAKRPSANASANANATAARGVPPGKCRYCKREKPNHFPANCPSVDCHSCGGKGHLSTQCPDPMCRFCGGFGHRQDMCSVAPRPRGAAGKAKAGTEASSGSALPATCSVGAGSSTGKTSQSVIKSEAGPSRTSQPVMAPAVARGSSSYAGAVSGLSRGTPARRETYEEKLEALFVGFKGTARQISVDAVNQELEGVAREEAELRRSFERSMEALQARRAELLREKALSENVADSVKLAFDAYARVKSSIQEMEPARSATGGSSAEPQRAPSTVTTEAPAVGPTAARGEGVGGGPRGSETTDPSRLSTDTLGAGGGSAMEVVQDIEVRDDPPEAATACQPVPGPEAKEEEKPAATPQQVNPNSDPLDPGANRESVVLSESDTNADQLLGNSDKEG